MKIDGLKIKRRLKDIKRRRWDGKENVWEWWKSWDYLKRGG